MQRILIGKGNKVNQLLTNLSDNNYAEIVNEIHYCMNQWIHLSELLEPSLFK